mgnify:CR=1 FL=1
MPKIIVWECISLPSNFRQLLVEETVDQPLSIVWLFGKRDYVNVSVIYLIFLRRNPFFHV